MKAHRLRALDLGSMARIQGAGEPAFHAFFQRVTVCYEPPMLLAAVSLTLAFSRVALAEDPAAALTAALQRSRPALRAAALDLTLATAERPLVEAIRPALRDPSEEVRRAALAALGRSRAPEALDALLEHSAMEANRLRSHPREQAQLFRSLGQHADARALRVLASNALASLEAEPLRARILALGRIRTHASVDALVALARSLPFAEEQQVLHELRVTFAVLTGETPGQTAASIVRAWGERRAGFVVPEELPALPPALARRWLAAWSETVSK